MAEKNGGLKGRGGGSERKGGGLKKKGGGFKKTGGGLNRKGEGLENREGLKKKGLEGEKKGSPWNGNISTAFVNRVCYLTMNDLDGGDLFGPSAILPKFTSRGCADEALVEHIKNKTQKHSDTSRCELIFAGMLVRFLESTVRNGLPSEARS